MNGISGFPKGKESPHDAFDTGHSSNSISAAAGMAAARDLKGERNEVIAIIGDGSLTGGMAYEGLNNVGASKSKMIVILNDNGMSISRNIGGVSQHLSKLRTSNGYLRVKKTIKRALNRIPVIGRRPFYKYRPCKRQNQVCTAVRRCYLRRTGLHLSRTHQRSQYSRNHRSSGTGKACKRAGIYSCYDEKRAGVSDGRNRPQQISRYQSV